MSFVVEDGSGNNPLANSYVSLTEWNTYFTDRNNAAAVAYTDAEKQAALIYATAYLDDTVSWYSIIHDTDQPLDWPRASFLDSEGRTVPGETIPQKIKDATMELALQHLSEGLNSTDGEGIAEESYGDASVKYRGSGNSRAFSFIKVMLKDYGTPGSLKTATLYRA